MDYNKSKEALDNANAVFVERVNGYTDKQRIQYSSHITNSYEIVSVAYIIQGILETFNIAKGKLDAAHKAQDADEFEKHLRSISALLSSIGFSDISRNINCRKKWLKVVNELRTVLVNQLNFLRDTRDNGAKQLKRMRMSPKQRAAAQKASVRQRIAWGM